MESGKNILCSRWREVSFYDSNAIWKTGICLITNICMTFLNEWYRGVRIKRYTNIFIGIEIFISCRNWYSIWRKSWTCIVFISFISTESVSYDIIPVRRCLKFGFLLRNLDGIRIKCEWILINRGKYNERKDSLQPLSTIPMMPFINWMFHTFTKRTKQL